MFKIFLQTFAKYYNKSLGTSETGILNMKKKKKKKRISFKPAKEEVEREKYIRGNILTKKEHNFEAN